MTTSPFTLALCLSLIACGAEDAPREDLWECPPICPNGETYCETQRPGASLDEDGTGGSVPIPSACEAMGASCTDDTDCCPGLACSAGSCALPTTTRIPGAR